MNLKLSVAGLFALAAFGMPTALVADDVPWVFSGSTNRAPVSAAIPSANATTARTKLANEAVTSSMSIVMNSRKLGLFIVVK